MANSSEFLARQTTLGLTLPEDKTFASFFPGDNAAALATLQRPWSQEIDRFMLLWGVPAVGKSHLLKASCAQAKARGLKPIFIPGSQIHHHPPEVLQQLENCDLICFDDIHLLLNDEQWEIALFHFYNRFSVGASHCIMSSDLPPNQLDIRLPDLRSRLNAASVFQIKELSQEDKQLALQQLVAARGLKCPPLVSQYILNHCGRDMRTLMQITQVLDQATLSAQKPLTIPFVKSILAIE